MVSDLLSDEIPVKTLVLENSLAAIFVLATERQLLWNKRRLAEGFHQ
jgi:hypothetical protein